MKEIRKKGGLSEGGKQGISEYKEEAKKVKEELVWAVSSAAK